MVIPFLIIAKVLALIPASSLSPKLGHVITVDISVVPLWDISAECKSNRDY